MGFIGQESEERAEADEIKERLTMKKSELEDMVAELSSKLEEGEEQTLKMAEEKKKMQVSVHFINYDLLTFLLSFCRCYVYNL